MAIVLLIWELGYSFFKLGLSPLQLGHTFLELYKQGDLVSGIIGSLQRMIVGYTFAMVLGVIIGVLITPKGFISDQMSAFFIGLQALPNVCWVPLAVLTFGYNEMSIFAILVLGSAFTIAISVKQGMRGTYPLYIKAAQTMGAKRLDMLRHIVLPSAMPVIIGGFRQGWAFAWRSLMAAEMIVATKGVGAMLSVGNKENRIEIVVAIIVIIITISLAIDTWLFGVLETKINRRYGKAIS